MAEGTGVGTVTRQGIAMSTAVRWALELYGRGDASDNRPKTVPRHPRLLCRLMIVKIMIDIPFVSTVSCPSVHHILAGVEGGCSVVVGVVVVVAVVVGGGAEDDQRKLNGSGEFSARWIRV